MSNLLDNLLEKGWAKTQPFKKRLGQKLQPMEEKVGPKITTDGGKGWAKNYNLLEKGWAKNYNLLEKGWAKNYNRWRQKVQAKQVGPKLIMRTHNYSGLNLGPTFFLHRL
jgi:hypothetical protein